MAEDGWNGSYEGQGWRVDDVSLCRGDPIPVLSLVKSVQAAGLPIEPGDAVTYTLVVANSGSADAAGVHITDTLPAGVSGTDLDQYVDVAAGSSVTLHIPVTVGLAAVRGQVIANTAYYVYSSTLACAPAPACTGSGNVTFAVGSQVYLPLILRSF